MRATATTTQTQHGTELTIYVPGVNASKSKLQFNFKPDQADLLYAVQKALMENQTGVMINPQTT
jgi:hypothetical protein